MNRRVEILVPGMIYSSDESKMWDSSHRQNRGAHQIEETLAVAWEGGGARPRKVFLRKKNLDGTVQEPYKTENRRKK
jgi:hypothetical protein